MSDQDGWEPTWDETAGSEWPLKPEGQNWRKSQRNKFNKFPGRNAIEVFSAGAMLAGMGKALSDVLGLLAILESPSERRRLFDSIVGVARRLQGIPFTEFKMSWAAGRQLVGLQARLYLEQALWLLGPPWSDLVTGFEPVSGLELSQYWGSRRGHAGAANKPETSRASPRQRAPQAVRLARGFNHEDPPPGGSRCDGVHHGFDGLGPVPGP